MSRICYSEVYGTRRPPVHKEVSFKLGKGVENVTSNCMGRPVRQFDKEVTVFIRISAHPKGRKT